MGKVFKKPIVRHTLNGRRCKAGTPGAVRTVEQSANWYGTVGGKKVPLSRDKRAAEQILRKRLSDADLDGVGLSDPFAAHKRTPLADHLSDYASHLTAKGDDARHVGQTVGRVRAMLIDGCGFARLPDVNVTPANDWLTTLGRDAAPVAIPPGAEFTPAQVSALLGVSPQAVSESIRRLRLPATGKGKARRLPRAAVERLVSNRTRGASPQTVNHYVKAVRGFMRWLVKTTRQASDPLDTLTLLNVKTDVRRARRELTQPELQRLLSATKGGDRTYRGLTGIDRFHLYLTAATSGFRAAALASLTPADFDLNHTQPTVTLPARFNKSGKTKEQPLPTETADALRVYLQGKPSSLSVWAGKWAEHFDAAEMIRGDLDAADIPYSVPGPDGPVYADFHALRHSFLTLLGRSGVDLRTAQVLAGHSTSSLTERYTHTRLHDQQRAVNKLPALTTTPPRRERPPFRPLRNCGPPAPTAGLVHLWFTRRRATSGRF